MSESVLDLGYGIGYLIAILLALAATPGIVKRLSLTDALATIRPLRNAVARRVLWLALAALLAMPIIDAVVFVMSVPQIASRSLWHSEAITAATAWGQAPWPLALLLTDILMLAAYCAVFGSCWGLLRASGASRFLTAVPTWQRVYLVAALASLFYSFLQATVVRVVWLRLPLGVLPFASGIGGFAEGWIFGLLLFVAIVTIFPNPFLDDLGEATAA